MPDLGGKGRTIERVHQPQGLAGAPFASKGRAVFRVIAGFLELAAGRAHFKMKRRLHAGWRTTL